MKNTNATHSVAANSDETSLSASATVARAQIKLLRLLAHAAVETLQRITQAEVDDANTDAGGNRDSAAKSRSN